MNIESIGDLIRGARAQAESRVEPGSERERLMRAAAEFESMLMLQMLKEMRKAGSWADDEEEKGYGAETMFETIDVELASHLSKAQGLGLGKQLLQLLDQEGAGADLVGGSKEPRVPDVAAMISGAKKLDPAYVTSTIVASEIARAGHREDVPAYEAKTPGAAESVMPSGRVEHKPSAGASAVEPILPSGSIDEPRDVPALEKPSGTVTSGFGWRQDPFHGAARFHRGIDIRAAYGQDIPAAGAGKVVSAGTEGGYGQTVVIEHAGGVRTRYAHLSTTLVARGDEVAEGQTVGQAGRSGRATGTHLHFEVMTASGEPLNPEQFAGFKRAQVVADFTHGTNPVLQETRRHDITN